MQIPIINGIYSDASGDFRTSYPRNLIPVPKSQGISHGYLRPADGLVQVGTGPGVDRGSHVWNGALYRVMGTKLVRVGADGSASVLGDVGSGGTVAMDHSTDRLAVASGGRLYYWDGTALIEVIDADLGNVIGLKFLAGYFITTDGSAIVVTSLNDPLSVSPLAYGSSEADPDPVMAIDELRGEAYAFNRFTIEAFQNVGGTGFPFQVIDGAQVTRGILGSHCFCRVGDTFAFLGSGRNEAPGVYLMTPGSSEPISTREIDTILHGYTEAQLAETVMECKTDKKHAQVLIHLPDRCLVYDAAATAAVGEPVWFTLDSGTLTPATYRARGFAWCYDRWNVGDPTSAIIGRVDGAISSHYGAAVGWDFSATILYNESSDGIIHELDLVCLTGHVAAGADPTIWTSYSHNGENWSQEKPTRAGKQGERSKRIAWRTQGTLRNWRIQRFRGTSEAHLSIARLQAQIEPLFAKAGSNG